MKTKEVTLSVPKTKRGALGQAAYIFCQIENISQRKENIMKNQEATTKKLLKLEETLENYRQQITELDTNSATWEVELKKLKDQWNLTDAEILELRSQLLREQISEMQKRAGVQETGKTILT